MTEKSWPWSTVAGVGDGATELSEALTREFLAVYFGVQDPATEGVSKGVLNELAVTGTASPLAVNTGSAICYGLYINDASVNNCNTPMTVEVRVSILNGNPSMSCPAYMTNTNLSRKLVKAMHSLYLS